LHKAEAKQRREENTTMTELARVRCKQGMLIITEQHISIELGKLRGRSIARSALTGIDSQLVIPSLFGLGGGTNLTFYAGAERLVAELVKPSQASNIKRLLGY
jgi:hypothetical protein